MTHLNFNKRFKLIPQKPLNKPEKYGHDVSGRKDTESFKG
jgi:hypothetical protein